MHRQGDALLSLQPPAGETFRHAFRNLGRHIMPILKSQRLGVGYPWAISTLQSSHLNALFESAQRPSWVGSTLPVSRLKWRFELRGNDLADPNNDKCLCMCHAMTVILWSAITSNVRESFRMAIINCKLLPYPFAMSQIPWRQVTCHLRMKSLSDSNSNIRESFRIYLQMEIFIAYQ